jgi:hypothetical protein
LACGVIDPTCPRDGAGSNHTGRSGRGANRREWATGVPLVGGGGQSPLFPGHSLSNPQRGMVPANPLRGAGESGGQPLVRSQKRVQWSQIGLTAAVQIRSNLQPPGLSRSPRSAHRSLLVSSFESMIGMRVGPAGTRGLRTMVEIRGVSFQRGDKSLLGLCRLVRLVDGRFELA